MIRFFRLYAALAALSLAGASAACDPPAMQRQAAPGYQMMPQQYAPPPGYMLVPIAPRQQHAPPPLMFAQGGYGAASYGGQAMIVSAPRAGYGAMAGPRGAYSAGGVAVSVQHQRAILPRNRGVSVGVAAGGMGAAVSVRTGRAGSRASGGCAT